MRRDARKDDNHNEVAAEFERLVWEVLDISQLKNCCDMFVAKGYYTVAVEVKDGSKPPSKRKLSAGEIEFRNRWTGAYALVLSVEDVRLIDKAAKYVEIRSRDDG